MTVFKYKEDQIPFTIIGLYFLVDITYFFMVDNLYFLLAWGGLGIVIKGIIAAWNHNHQHCNTFHQPVLNRMVEIIFGMYTGICGYAWVLHHNIGHHSNFLDQTKDESRWKNSKGQKMLRLRYSLEVFITSYYRCFIVGLKHPKVLRSFLLMTALTGGILLTLTYFRPIPALIVLWIPGVLSLLITADSTYWHHSGLDTDNAYAASRNTIDSRCFNILTGNFGYHTAHHLNAGLHWTKLPKLHERYKDRIPPECYIGVTPFFAMVDFCVEKTEFIFSKNNRKKVRGASL